MRGPLKRKLMTGYRLAVFGMAASLALSVSAFAGMYDQQQMQQYPQSHQQQMPQSMQPMQRQPSQQNQQALIQVEPEGWIWVGYDYDRDGRIDGYEYISAYDIEIARQRSAQRMQDFASSGQIPGRHMMQQDQQRMSRWNQQRMMQRGQQEEQLPAYYESPAGRQQIGRMTGQDFDRVRGSITGMRTVELAGVDEQHVLAKVSTQGGRTARVDLGPKDQVQKLNLQKGDQIAAFGSSGSINDMPVLTAHRIRSNGQTANISHSDDFDLKRINAKVLGTQPVTFQNANVPQQLFARVRLDNNQTTVVNLGPQKNLSNISLQPGENIAMLARPAEINGKLALVAEEIHADGKTIDIERRTDQGQQSQQSKQTQSQ